MTVKFLLESGTDKLLAEDSSYLLLEPNGSKLGIVAYDSWTRQPDRTVDLSSFGQKSTFFLYANEKLDRISKSFGTRTSVAFGGVGSGFGANFSNTTNQGWSFPNTLITGTKHTILFVGNPRVQGAQRNCAINQRRSSNGFFVGIGFNQTANVTTGAIDITSGAFSYQIFSSGPAGIGANVTNAVTGKLSAYLISRNDTSFVVSIDGTKKEYSLATDSSNLSAYTTSVEFNIGDLGQFSSTGYTYQDGFVLAAIWPFSVSQSEADKITANPWQLFAP